MAPVRPGKPPGLRKEKKVSDFTRFTITSHTVSYTCISLRIISAVLLEDTHHKAIMPPKSAVPAYDIVSQSNIRSRHEPSDPSFITPTNNERRDATHTTHIYTCERRGDAGASSHQSERPGPSATRRPRCLKPPGPHYQPAGWSGGCRPERTSQPTDPTALPSQAPPREPPQGQQQPQLEHCRRVRRLEVRWPLTWRRPPSFLERGRRSW